MTHAKDKKPATPRAAASILFVHQREYELFLLTGRRNPASRFMPNMRVFPGGGVEPSDPTDLRLKPRIEAFAEAEQLPVSASALVAAGLREAEEETGFVLKGDDTASRCDILARAITPTTLPIRFDTCFFAVSVSDDEAALDIHDSDELLDVGWHSLPEVEAKPIHRITAFLLAHLKHWWPAAESERKVALARPTADDMNLEFWP